MIVSDYRIIEGERALVLDRVDESSAVAAFSLRKGGVSQPPTDSLNFSSTHGDTADNVRVNLGILSAQLRIDPRRVVTCRQVHGDTVHVIGEVPDKPPEADAIVTSISSIFPAVKTADCLPVLLLDPVKKIAAAVHAGWRGTVLRITRKVVHLMEDCFGTETSNLVAALGPAIGPCCYEVDNRVLVPLSRNVPDWERFVTPTTGEETLGAHPRFTSFRLDLVAVNEMELTMLGVHERNIFRAGFCTSCTPALFFSHRRDGAPSGRHIAIAGFRG